MLISGLLLVWDRWDAILCLRSIAPRSVGGDRSRSSLGGRRCRRGRIDEGHRPKRPGHHVGLLRVGQIRLPWIARSGTRAIWIGWERAVGRIWRRRRRRPCVHWGLLAVALGNWLISTVDFLPHTPLAGFMLVVVRHALYFLCSALNARHKNSGPLRALTRWCLRHCRVSGEVNQICPTLYSQLHYLPAVAFQLTCQAERQSPGWFERR
ncbi:hypothetical protein C8R46DRAFT_1140559 [Mycena filopes]|nr:hypothetical protein C8R46DRAFT_1140559 [Mycena filopes]